MSNFIPNKHHLREVLLHYFIAKKSAVETYRLLVEVYGEHAPSNTTCKEWFRRFQNGDFYLIGSKYQLDDTCDYNFTYEVNFSTGKTIVDEQFSSCDENKTDIPKDDYKEFIHKFTVLKKMNGFRIGENKFKIPNSNKYFYY